MYGTLTIFAFFAHPTTDPDRPTRRHRRTLYKAYGLSQEGAQNQTLAFVDWNKSQIKPDSIWATWQPEPIELDTK